MLILHTTVTLCKKSEQLCLSIFVKLEKLHFGSSFGTFGPKTSKQNFSAKNYLCQF